MEGAVTRISQLSDPCKRRVKRLEQAHGRICRSVWEFWRIGSDRYIFGSFCAPRGADGKLDRDIYTIAVWSPALYKWVAIQ